MTFTQDKIEQFEADSPQLRAALDRRLSAVVTPEYADSTFSRVQRAYSSALPIALVLIALAGFLTWQGYCWWNAHTEAMAKAVAGPWAAHVGARR